MILRRANCGGRNNNKKRQLWANRLLFENFLVFYYAILYVWHHSLNKKARINLKKRVI